MEGKVSWRFPKSTFFWKKCQLKTYNIENFVPLAQGRTGPPEFGEILGGLFQAGPFSAKHDQKVLNISYNERKNWKNLS